MREFSQEFLGALEQEDKERAVQLVVQLLEAGDVGIVQLYTDVLVPAQNEWRCSDDEATWIWKEHVRSSIIRTILEVAWPYVLKEWRAKGLPSKDATALVLCPPEELHEIGPRMVADFFTLSGFDVTFVGANTPIETTMAAIKSIAPRYVAISVTNHYHLIALRKTIERVRKDLPDGTEIIVGGRAFKANPDLAKEIGADKVLTTFEDIQALDGGA